MGGKKRHSKDRMFITATEWKTEYGGKKIHTNNRDYRPLPFDHCALSLSQFQDPVCTEEGVVFDLVNLADFIKKHGKNPISGAPMSVKDITRLHMAKNSEGKWHCPVTFKTFNNNSSIAAIRTTGNVFALEAVKELNIAPKNFTDLLTGESFKRSDVIVLQDPTDPTVSARRDINSFEHLKTLRSTAAASKAAEGTVRHNPTTSTIMEEINKKQTQEQLNPTAKSNPALLSSRVASTESTADVDDILALKATIDEVCPGRVVSDQKAGGSFTSTAQEVVTSSTVRQASIADIREARWKKMREVGKKGYVQLQTNIGNLNLEIHCDCAQRTSWNFLTLCERGYYNDTIFHRLVPGFIIQGGDPTGTGSGGESAFGGSFRDEFDSRLVHDQRGILSMANSGANTNNSQFFVTFAPASHLDLVHCVFGRVVGGNATLDRMEATDADKDAVPVSEIKILSTHVMVNPISEADTMLVEQIMSSRAANKAAEVKPNSGQRAPISANAKGASEALRAITGSAATSLGAVPSVGKYLGTSSVGASRTATPVVKQTAGAVGQTQADRIAAFMRSQGGGQTSSDAANPAKKRRMGDGFSSW